MTVAEYFDEQWTIKNGILPARTANMTMIAIPITAKTFTVFMSFTPLFNHPFSTTD